MNEQNQKALLYLGLAAVIVVAGILAKKNFDEQEAKSKTPIVQEIPKQPDVKNPIDGVDTQPDGKGPISEENGGTRVSRYTVYKNPSLGFSVGLPAGWYAPATTDNDPHFYSCVHYECDMAFEIQRSDDIALNGFDAAMKQANDDQLRPTEMKWLVKGARVIKSDAPGAADGWNDQYLVIFEKEQRAYTVFVNGWRAERLILPSLKVLK